MARAVPWNVTHEPAREPTDDDACAAVQWLSDGLLRALAEGPTEDPKECHVCEVLEEHWMGDSRFSAHAATISDYHDFYANHGQGEESYRRCQRIYEWAREELAVRERRYRRTQ